MKKHLYPIRNVSDNSSENNVLHERVFFHVAMGSYPGYIVAKEHPFEGSNPEKKMPEASPIILREAGDVATVC